MGVCDPRAEGRAADALPWRQIWPCLYLLTGFFSSSSLSSLAFISVKGQPPQVISCSIGHIKNEVNYIKAQGSVVEIRI